MKVIGIDKDAYELLDLVHRKVGTSSFIFDPQMVDSENTFQLRHMSL